MKAGQEQRDRIGAILARRKRERKRTAKVNARGGLKCLVS